MLVDGCVKPSSRTPAESPGGARHPVWRRARTTMSSRSAGRHGAAGARGHTPPLCFYNFKSQTGCVSSATLFCGNQVSAFVPPLHPTQFFAGPPRVRLLSASCPPQFFAGPLRVRPMSAPIFCGSASCSVLSASCPHQFLFGSASCPPRVRPSFLQIRLLSASCPPQFFAGPPRVRLLSASCPRALFQIHGYTL